MIEGARRGLFAAIGAAAALLVAPRAAADPALWAVSGQHGTVYLFGSVHLLPIGGFTIGGALAKALRESESVCLEVDTGAIDAAESASLTLARAVDPDGRDLFELLGPAADRVRASAAAAAVDIEQFAPFEPWFAGLTVSVMALQQNGYDVEHGVEQIIQAEAKKTGKPGCGLETLDDQLGMLDGLPDELQLELLLQSLEEAGEVDEIIRPLLAAWRDGDERRLEERLEEDFDDYPELAEALIFDRNERWADQVSEMLDGSDDVLVVVGAMHLVGDRGLPALLEERGFRVARR